VDLRLTEDELSFRDALREWLNGNLPGPHPADPLEAIRFSRDWQKRLYDAGYAGLSWPREFGGRGATVVEQALFNQEIARLDLPGPINIIGMHMVGPSIIHHGTEDQRARFLRPILTADELWCQGFSEPGAGSDLASLTTRAVKNGHEWIITGQKVWTSLAHYADWCILLARTNPEAPKHKGLTFFLMNMHQSGVQPRPLRTATGDSEFNEMFLDEARVPDELRLGPVDAGWTVALTTLMHERGGAAFTYSVAVRNDLNRVIEACREQGILDDPVLRLRLAKLHIDVENLRLNGLRGLSAQMDGRQPGPEGSLAKWQWSEVYKAMAAFVMDAFGSSALDPSSRWSFMFMRSLATGIEAGTTDILKNVIAERVLGLPKGPR
jgi:alkylation response protein AidB-like acyl-CoA dehydrogenase